MMRMWSLGSECRVSHGDCTKQPSAGWEDNSVINCLPCKHKTDSPGPTKIQAHHCVSAVLAFLWGDGGRSQAQADHLRPGRRQGPTPEVVPLTLMCTMAHVPTCPHIRQVHMRTHVHSREHERAHTHEDYKQNKKE